jgi:hypothetical protein
MSKVAELFKLSTLRNSLYVGLSGIWDGSVVQYQLPANNEARCDSSLRMHGLVIDTLEWPRRSQF